MKIKLLAAATMLAAFPAVTAGVASAQRAPAATVVVIDTERVYRECTACAAAQAQIQSQVAALQARQQALGTPIQTEMQSIQTAAEALRNQPAGAARTSQEQALQNRLQALQTQEQTANQELGQLQDNIRSTIAHVRQQIDARLAPIYQSVMTARGANLAVSTAATLAHAGALNVTNDVLAQLNQQLPAVSVTPLPQPAAPAPAAGQPTPPPAPRPTGR